MIQQLERKSKLSPKFVGSYRIVCYVYGNKFEVMEPNTNIALVIHSDWLKKIPPPSDSPLAADSIPVEQADTHREQVTQQASHIYNEAKTLISPNLQVRMLCLQILLVTFVGWLLAITPIHLKPGTLTPSSAETSIQVFTKCSFFSRRRVYSSKTLPSKTSYIHIYSLILSLCKPFYV